MSRPSYQPTVVNKKRVAYETVVDLGVSVTQQLLTTWISWSDFRARNLLREMIEWFLHWSVDIQTGPVMYMYIDTSIH